MAEPETPFAGQPAGSTEQDERRRLERFAPDTNSAWKVASQCGTIAPWGSVRDLSAAGVGLLVAQPLKPGAVLVITLQHGTRKLARPLPVRVMHCSPAAEGGWLVGCQFVRKLSGPELQVLVGGE